MTDEAISRRRMLGVAGTAAALALAGCTSSASPDSGGSTSANPTTASAEHSGHDDGDHEEEHDFASEDEVYHLSDRPVAEATVEMTMLSETEPVFSPEIAWVEPGGSVTWKNVDEEQHTATAYAPANDGPQRIPDGAQAWDSGLLKTGETFTQTFETEGVYDYYCLPHEGLGMVGVVIVGRPDLPGQPAMAEPQDSVPKQARSALSDLHDRVRATLTK